LRSRISPFTNTAYKYGFGFYETLRAIDKKIIFFDEHIRRLQNSLKQFKLPNVDPAEIYNSLINKIERKKLRDTRIRITYSLQGEKLNPIITYEILPFTPTFREKAKITFSIYRLKHDEKIRQFKTTNNFIYFYEFQNAKARGYDEVIFFDEMGHLLEGSRTNIFLIFYDKRKDNFNIKTPAIDCGILPGIGREKVFEICKQLRIKITQERLNLESIRKAEEIFLTNSVQGIINVNSFPGKKNLKSEKTDLIREEFTKRYLLTY
jgi:branched-subunit amino acid aminotransferase/4-amino-4-deoxychorismate lyase